MPLVTLKTCPLYIYIYIYALLGITYYNLRRKATLTTEKVSCSPGITIFRSFNHIVEHDGFGWRGDIAPQQLFRLDVLSTVEALVDLGELNEDGTLDADAGKETLGPCVGEHGGELAVLVFACDRSLAASADRACAHSQVAADGHVPAARKRAHGFVAVQDQDDIGNVGPDLGAKANATGGDRRGRAPS